MADVRPEEVVTLMRAHARWLNVHGCAGDCNGLMFDHAADVLARRITWTDNLWYALISIPAEHRTPHAAAIMAEYETVRNDDSHWQASRD